MARFSNIGGIHLYFIDEFMYIKILAKVGGMFIPTLVTGKLKSIGTWLGFKKYLVLCVVLYEVAAATRIFQ